MDFEVAGENIFRLSLPKGRTLLVEIRGEKVVVSGAPRVLVEVLVAPVNRSGLTTEFPPGAEAGKLSLEVLPLHETIAVSIGGNASAPVPGAQYLVLRQASDSRLGARRIVIKKGKDPFAAGEIVGNIRLNTERKADK